MFSHGSAGVGRLLHSEQFHLFLPGERQVGVEFRQGKRPRRSPFEDGLHDGRGQQRQPQEAPDVGHVHVQRFRQGFRRIEFAAVKELLPTVGAGYARGQRFIDLQLFVGEFRIEDPLAAGRWLSDKKMFSYLTNWRIRAKICLM